MKGGLDPKETHIILQASLAPKGSQDALIDSD